MLVKALHPSVAPESLIECVQDRPFNDVRYFLNFNKLLELGWKPEMGFEDGLKRTIAFYEGVDKDWWECGTDSSLAAHPHAKGAHVELK